jgi:uncharacterized protein YbaP (TraB family)
VNGKSLEYSSAAGPFHLKRLLLHGHTPPHQFAAIKSVLFNSKETKMTEQEEKKLTEQVEDLAQLMRELAIERRQVMEQNSFLRAIGSLNDGVRNEFI